MTTADARSELHRRILAVLGLDTHDEFAGPLTERQGHAIDEFAGLHGLAGLSDDEIGVKLGIRADLHPLYVLADKALNADGSPSDQGLYAVLADDDRLTAYLDAAELVAR